MGSGSSSCICGKTKVKIRKGCCLIAANKIMSEQNAQNSWPLWEVFIRSRQGLDHKHVGSLHAADAAMAIENARDVYTRRMEGVSTVSYTHLRAHETPEHLVC